MSREFRANTCVRFSSWTRDEITDPSCRTPGVTRSRHFQQLPRDADAERVPEGSIFKTAGRVTEVCQSIIVRLQQGDIAALEPVFHTYGDRVYSICRRITGREADADDATQEVFLRAWDQIGKFSGRSRFSTWLFRLTVNHTQNYLKAAKRRIARSLSDLPEAAIPSDNGHPSEVLSRKEECAHLDHMLQKLPLDQRTVLVLRELERMSYAEIGEVLGIPAGTVTSRLVRGRERLKELLLDSRTNKKDTDDFAGVSCPRKRAQNDEL